MQTARVYPQKKTQMYNRLIELSQKHKVIAMVKMEKVRATQLMQVRKKFRNEMKIMIDRKSVV